MTKLVRIENADNSNHRVLVEVWQTTEKGDFKIRDIPLDHPTYMAQEYIHSSQFLVVKEQ
jgi:hypothetical protein